MASADYDVLIIGGGLVGASLAALLAADPSLEDLRLGLLDAQAPTAPPPADETDLRVSAISRASQALLASAGAWQRLDAAQVSPYTDMVVWDARGQPGGAGSIRFSAAETGAPDLGAIVENRRLLWALYSTPALRERVTVLRSALAALSFPTGAGRVTATFADGRRATAQLVVGADGAASPSRTMAGIEVTARSYHQSAVVTHVRTAQPHRQTARQRFLPTGPLAFLPLADGRSSIVWSTTPDAAARLKALPAGEFASELLVASDGVLGPLELAAPRAVFPLQLMHADRYCRPGYVIVGDAAHAVHPLAGQGVNLGFADAAALVSTLAAARAGDAQGWADRRVLRRYERWRKRDNLLAASVIDGLGRLFGADDPRLAAARRLGLRWLGRSVTARRLLVDQASR